MTDNKNIHVNYFEVPGEYDGELSEVEELRKRVENLEVVVKGMLSTNIELTSFIKGMISKKGKSELRRNMKRIFDTGKILNQPTMEMFETLFDSIVFKDEI